MAVEFGGAVGGGDGDDGAGDAGGGDDGLGLPDRGCRFVPTVQRLTTGGVVALL